MKKLPSILSKEEFEKIFDAEKKKEYKLAFLLGFEAGLRISEIVGLKIDGEWKIKPLEKEQVDLEGHSIRILGKGGKMRIVPLPKRFNKGALELLPIKKSRRSLQHRIEQIAWKTINKKIHFHTLRHGFGSHLAGKNVPLHEIQMLMGHSRLDTTGIYLHANPKQAIEQARDVF